MHKNRRETMKPLKLWTIVLFAPLIFLAFAQLSSASVTTVIGQNIPAVDPQNIQAAINASDPGDTLILQGTFDFGATGYVSIQTEGLTIQGLINPSGNRATNNPTYWLTTITGGDTPFRSTNVGITIQDLYFNHTQRCVVFPNGSTGGDIILRNNRVENVIPIQAPLYPSFLGYFAAFIYTVYNPLTIVPVPQIMGNLTIESNYIDLLNPTPSASYPDYSMASAVAINLGRVASTGTTTYVKIKNNILKNPGFAGISFNPGKLGSGPVEYQVENNTIEQPLLPYDMANYVWSGINPEGRGGGIHSFASSNPSNAAIVRNNHMLNCGWGLLLGGMDGSIFDSNIIENTVPTTGNFISPITFYGFNNSATYQNTNNIISNNIITGANQYGVGGGTNNTPPTSSNIFVGNDFSEFTATTAQVYLNSAASGNYFGPDKKNRIPTNIFGPLGEDGIAGIVDNGFSNSFVKNDYSMSGILGKKYSEQVSVLLSETSHDDFVDESGMFPPGTGGAKDQVTNLGTNNRVVGHPAKSVPDSKDRGIGKRLRAIEEQLAAQQ
jgi:hypothetical protein